MSCRCRWIDSASVRDLIAHGYSLIDRKPAVGVGATWRFAGTPPNLAASTHARASTEVRKAPGRLPEEDKGGALRSLLIESDFPVDATYCFFNKQFVANRFARRLKAKTR